MKKVRKTLFYDTFFVFHPGLISVTFPSVFWKDPSFSFPSCTYLYCTLSESEWSSSGPTILGIVMLTVVISLLNFSSTDCTANCCPASRILTVSIVTDETVGSCL